MQIIMRKIVKKITNELLNKYSRQNSAQKKIRRDSFNDIYFGMYLWGKYWDKYNKDHPTPKISWQKEKDKYEFIKRGKFVRAIRSELKKIRKKDFLIKYQKIRYADFDKIKINDKTKIVIAFLFDDEARKYHLVDIYPINLKSKKIINLVKRILGQYGYMAINKSERDELKKKKKWDNLFLADLMNNNYYPGPRKIDDKELVDMGIIDKKYYPPSEERKIYLEYEDKSFEFWLDSFFLLAKEKYAMAVKKFIQQSIDLINKINKKIITKEGGGKYFKGLEPNLQKRTFEPVCNSYYSKNLAVFKNLQKIINKGKQLNANTNKDYLEKMRKMCQEKLKTKIKIQRQFSNLYLVGDY